MGASVQPRASIATELHTAPRRRGERGIRPGGNHAGYVCFRRIVEVGQRPARADHDVIDPYAT
jgi:hypothetical protein